MDDECCDCWIVGFYFFSSRLAKREMSENDDHDDMTVRMAKKLWVDGRGRGR
jgi:hypothetical protein